MYKVIKEFNGSQDGRFTTHFNEGDVVALSPALAEVALANKWVEDYGKDEEEMSYKDLSKKQLEAEARSRDLKVPNGASKKDFIALLEESDLEE